MAGRKAALDGGDRLSGFGASIDVRLPPADLDWADVLEEFEERAAIIELDGGTARGEAERAALAYALSEAHHAEG